MSYEQFLPKARSSLLVTSSSKANSLSSWFSNALGIGAASFWSVAEKDIAESPARSERPKK